jgi:hypothetical protein
MEKIIENPDLRRDMSNNAIINVNSDYYYAARARKLKNKIRKNEIQEMKNEISEIKSILNKVINILHENKS